MISITQSVSDSQSVEDEKDLLSSVLYVILGAVSASVFLLTAVVAINYVKSLSTVASPLVIRQHEPRPISGLNSNLQSRWMMEPEVAPNRMIPSTPTPTYHEYQVVPGEASPYSVSNVSSKLY